MDSVEPQTTFAPLAGDVDVDVLIIGGGLAGVLTAHHLQQAGVDYLLVEADRVGRGVSCNTTAKVTLQHGLIYDKLARQRGLECARRYYHANKEALERYRALSKSLPCDWQDKPSYVYTRGDTAAIEREVRVAKRLGIKAQYTHKLPLPFRVTGAVCFEGQGQLNPLLLLDGLARGLHICEQTRVRELVGTTAVTNRGRIKARRIVMATHFPILNKHGGYFVKMYQHRSYVLALENARDVRGMYLDADERGLSFRNYGELLLLGGGSHRTGNDGGNWRELRRFAARHYPNAKEVAHWATQDCMTLDGVPYVGRYGGSTEGLYVITGFNKWGFTSAMAGAMVLTDLLMGRKHPAAAVFNPNRPMAKGQLLLNAGAAAVNLLTPSAPRCPHMGCALKWNRAEKSWDCPCHGSRFGEQGKLLDNPATGTLKR